MPIGVETPRRFTWSIPKGLITPGEAPLDSAKREFGEETGYEPRGKFISLGDVKQPGGKVVHVWAVENDWDEAGLKSNLFEMEWPPRSGRLQKFPEVDRAAWFGILEAREKILKGQALLSIASWRQWVSLKAVRKNWRAARFLLMLLVRKRYPPQRWCG